MSRTPQEAFDPIRIEVFKHLFAAVAEEMGVVLRRTGYSPNIKERRDFSCAVFDRTGNMVAQAAHIPVHLGAMPLSVQTCLKTLQLHPGDVAILNDPFAGGTHLPDITLIAPVYSPEGVLYGFVANRAHHADVGGMAAGSMPNSREIYQEGLRIPPLKLISQGERNEAVWELLLANVRTPEERAGDLRAQLAANAKGLERMEALRERYGLDELTAAVEQLLAYSERLTRRLLATLPDGRYSFADALDDDGVTEEPVRIAVTIHIQGNQATVDFSDSSPQRPGNVNCVYAVTASATYYAFRSLLGVDVPSNSGCYLPIRVMAPEGSVVNARPPAAVAAGNVETSQRIVDVVLGALAQACPERIPAASQGTMNNLTIGGWDPRRNAPFAYYETIGGGTGAGPGHHGTSAVHSHMTNTLNTPIEALEYAYPLRVRQYAIRDGSGGLGTYRGGDGIRREVELLTDAQVGLLTERRRLAPYGLRGGRSGAPGRNYRIDAHSETTLPGKITFHAPAGTMVGVATPGGGGFGPPSNDGTEPSPEK